MSPVCLIVRALHLPGDSDAGNASQLAWWLGRQLVAKGEAVTLLHTGWDATINDLELAAAAKKQGIAYESLRNAAPPYPVPLFPSAEVHGLAHKLSARIAELNPRVCLVCDSPELAAVATMRRETGASHRETRWIVVADALPSESRRMAQDQLPTGGREEIIRDYFDRVAWAKADAVVCSDATLRESFLASGYAPKERLIILPSPEQANGEVAVAAWLPFILSGPAERATSALPRVTVCMPFYEQPGFLDDALSSLAAQTVAPHEVILMDDGSTSPAALAAYANAEKRHASRGWKFLRQTNAGPAAARNRMVELATGDAVLFCDADNRFRPEMVESLARAVAETGADCVTCAFQTFNSPVTGGPPAAADESAGDPGYVFSPLGDCLELGLIENVLGDTNFLVRRSVFQAQGGFRAERLADEDWQFLLQLLRHGRRVVAVPSVLFEYRRMATSRARRQGEFASAVITLAPILAETDPAWRRLWPHLVAAIRNPQVPQLEHALRSAQLQREADLARLQSELAEAKRLIRRQHWEIVVQKAATDRALSSAAGAAAERDSAAKRSAALEQEIARISRERDEAVAQRDDKIRRMQASWSWQVTAPGRAVRRAVLDPLRREPEPPSAAVQPAAQFAIDKPAFWDAAPASGTISGWCLFAGSHPAVEVRATVAGTIVPGESGHARPDVVDAHSLPASALRCGFEFRYRLSPDETHAVRVEAKASDGSWHLLHEGTLITTSRPRDVHDYTAWVASFSTLTPEKATALRRRLATLPPAKRPLISVLMPVHNAPERWLERAIASVREQIYEQWELCIADDASTHPHVRTVLERAQAADSRIRVVFRPANGHISAASNSALEIVRGEFVALLDHDDELPPDALAEVALLLADAPDTDLVYSDEDKIDEDGRRFTPYFKPDFLPDLLLGQNCLSHLSVFRTSLVRAVGGFRVGYEGSQDWDLALRVVDRSAPERIRHIPKILYHWRAISGSTAVAVSAKNYSVDAARRALQDHFARRGIAASVAPVTGDHWRIVFPLPEIPPLVSIIVPTKNAADLVRMCVGSIFARTEYPRFEILIVNNRSDDPVALALFDELRREEAIRVLDFDAPFNFSAINNFAVRHARGEVLCFLNNDIEVITGRWLDEMVSHALRPEIGAVGAMLYYPNNTIQHAGVILGLGGIANHAFVHYRHGTDGYMNRARLAQNYSAVTGACLLLRRDVFERAGGFNESDLAVAFNDIDLCLRVQRLGLRNLWTPFAELYHHESASRGSDEAPEKKARFRREIEYMQRTWGPVIERDPAYNPNLSVDLLGWALAWPPRA